MADDISSGILLPTILAFSLGSFTHLTLPPLLNYSESCRISCSCCFLPLALTVSYYGLLFYIKFLRVTSMDK